MKNNRLTNKEIIKACENCIHLTTCIFCNGGGCTAKDCGDYIESTLINRLQAENNDLFYKLTGVMHSVDKWLDGDELEQDEVGRAATMREKTLRLIEAAETKTYEDCVKKIKENAQLEIYCDDRLPETIRIYHIKEDTLDNILRERIGEE